MGEANGNGQLHRGDRERLPDRRRCWTQRVKIGDRAETFYLTCGLYPDGRLGEIWIEAHKEGSFSRGVLSGLARTVSIALQNGTSAAEIVRSLRHLNFPPNGAVAGEYTSVRRCSSVPDWVAQELEAAFLLGKPAEAAPAATPTVREG